MTDIQVLTIALALIIPLSMLLYSNSRVSDARDALNKRIDDTRDVLRSEIQMAFERLDRRMERLETKIDGLTAKLEAHELEHHQ